jgi:ABC-type phosphate transport system substrate-binding protein
LRIMKTLVAVAASAAATTALAVVAPAALADPPVVHHHTLLPHPWDVVGTGSQTTAYVVDALAAAYDANQRAHHHASTPTNPYLYSWDGVPAGNPLDLTQDIQVKAGCPKNQVRPDGSTHGIASLIKEGNTSYKYKGKRHTAPCVDFARSSRTHSSSDTQPNGPGGIQFVILARDAVSYATTSDSNAPSEMSTKQLSEIFNCSIPAANGDPANSWGALFGNHVKSPKSLVAPVLPQSGSGTLAFWETTLSIKTTETNGEPACGPAAKIAPTKLPEENEGIDPIFRNRDSSKGDPNPNVIYPFSIGAFVDEVYHSAKCGKKPSKTQNQFGCDEQGVLTVRSINGTTPLARTGHGKTAETIINPNFSQPFRRSLFDVVRWATGQKEDIPAYEQRFFGKSGFFCSKAAFNVIRDYGFEPTDLCGDGE